MEKETTATAVMGKETTAVMEKSSSAVMQRSMKKKHKNRCCLWKKMAEESMVS